MEDEKLFNLGLNSKRIFCHFIKNCKVSINKKGCKNHRYKVFDLKTFRNISFCTRTAAIMWLKLYGREDRTYMQNNLKQIRVWNHYVYFTIWTTDLEKSAESKKTCSFAIRNN